MIPEKSTRPGSSLAASTSSSISSEERHEAPWEAYPFHLSTYNPLTEWGEHYQRVFNEGFWPEQSSFDLQELRGTSVSACTRNLATRSCIAYSCGAQPNVASQAQKKLTEFSRYEHCSFKIAFLVTLLTLPP